MRQNHMEEHTMLKTVAPFYEPMPCYMQKLTLMGARFIEGNTGEGATGGTKTQEVEQEPPKEPKPQEPEVDGFKSKESKDAVLADLQKERADRKQAQADLAGLNTQVETLTESLTEKDSAISERDAQIAQKDSEIAVLRLALDKGVHSQEDIDLLAAVTDDEKRQALADRLAKQAGVIRKSGTGGNESSTGGSIAEYRRQIAERKQK